VESQGRLHLRTLRNQTFRLAETETKRQKSQRGSNKRFDTTGMISLDGKAKLAKTRKGSWEVY